MPTPLLRTKLYIPPVRSNLVPRPRLTEQLNTVLDRKLTLISAPAGFGKTTLLSEWVAHCRLGIADSGLETSSASTLGNRVAWLSPDEGDNDPTRFLEYLIAAWQAVKASIGETALAAVQSPQPPPIESLMPLLLNKLPRSKLRGIQPIRIEWKFFNI